MPIASLGIGVYKMRFCAFSMPQATACSDEDILHACEKNPAFMTEVMLGRANVVYVAETTVAENSKIVRIHLKSDCRIAQGVLGYLYRVDNCDIVNAFPASIDKGKKTFPPILIPRECEIKVSHMESQFAGNVQITVKKSKFLF